MVSKDIISEAVFKLVAWDALNACFQLVDLLLEGGNLLAGFFEVLPLLVPLFQEHLLTVEEVSKPGDLLADLPLLEVHLHESLLATGGFLPLSRHGVLGEVVYMSHDLPVVQGSLVAWVSKLGVYIVFFKKLLEPGHVEEQFSSSVVDDLAGGHLMLVVVFVGHINPHCVILANKGDSCSCDVSGPRDGLKGDLLRLDAV